MDFPIVREEGTSPAGASQPKRLRCRFRPGFGFFRPVSAASRLSCNASSSEAHSAQETQMVKKLMWGWLGALAISSATQAAEKNEAPLDAPMTLKMDISAPPRNANQLPRCRLSGHVTLWVSRRVAIVDEMDERLGLVEAGLAEFKADAKLEECVPDGAVLNLSDRFVNFVIADNRPWNGGQFGERQARAVASLLAEDFYRLADMDGTPIPLVDGIKIGALGSTAYRFVIVLIKGAQPSAIDAVISRDTLRTKFAPRLPEADRRLSRLKWSSTE
jgi:hypothetical protein